VTLDASSTQTGRQKIRLVTLLFPPAGMLLLWKTRGISAGRKVFASLVILLYMGAYAALVVAVLWKFFGLQYEFRGGAIPYLTWRKTMPDYDALEANRAAQQRAAGNSNAVPLASSDWNGFRGPARDGAYREQAIRTEWPREGLPPLWKQPVGGGYASFAVAGNAAFTIEQRREEEVVVAYDITTGRELWTHGWKAEFQEPLGGDGPRATPAFDDGKVYALGALGELRCLDASSGKLLWGTNVLDQNRAPVLTYGTSASPLIHEEKLIVLAGGPRKHSVAAYDKTNGKPLWGSLDDGATYSSPMIARLAGEELLLVLTKRGIAGLRPSDGSIRWQFPWIVMQNQRQISQPLVVGTNRVFLSAGYGTGCTLLEVTKSGERFAVRELWRNKNLKNKFASSVLIGDAIYGLDEDILTCLSVETGERFWKEGRYGYGQVIAAGSQLIVLCGNGDLAIVKADPGAHEVIARFPAIAGKTWNVPAISSGFLLVRNSAEMACFDLRPVKP
jgi:outer membrane protein assembly factor BamB